MKVKLLFIPILFGAALFIIVSCLDRDLCCDEYAFEVIGEVSDSITNLPIESVLITWNDTINVEPVLTDTSGAYKLTVPVTLATIIARKQGYLSRSVTLEFNTSEVHVVDFKLPPE